MPSEGDSEAIETQTAWKPVCTSVCLFPFTGKEELCVQPGSGTEDGKLMPIDIFNFFISDDVVDHMVTETNRFALQRIEQLKITCRSPMKDWKGTTSDEIRTLIGLLIYMGLVQKPEISLYWSKSTLY